MNKTITIDEMPEKVKYYTNYFTKRGLTGKNLANQVKAKVYNWLEKEYPKEFLALTGQAPRRNVI